MEVLIPSTFAAEERDPKLKTLKIGRLARAIAIFGIEQVTIYKDQDPKLDERRNATILRKVLNYAECPPYLRRDLIPLDDDLQYANVLPALKIPSHGYPQSEQQKQYREAVVKEKRGSKAVLDAGLEEKVAAHGFKTGERVTVRLKETGVAEKVDQGQIPGFWTYEVNVGGQTLGQLLQGKDKAIVGTSRYGSPLEEAREDLKALEDYVLVFGSAWRGLYTMIDREQGLAKEDFDLIVNTIPGQNVSTVRTDEALLVSLGILNSLS